jgi:UDP-glucuronate decarboxylase
LSVATNFDPPTDTSMNAPLALVTGGAGFLGSHLCERLLDLGHRVIAYDDLSTGHRSHVDHLAHRPGFRLVVHDITQPLPDDPALAEVGRVFNLACPASPSKYQLDPVQTTLTSVLGIWHLLQLAERTGARLLQTSTSEIYGNPQVHPQVESYPGHVDPVGPRACYDEGKRCAETLCDAFRRQGRADVRIARLFNSYGPRLRPGDGRVVSNFVVQALRGEPLTVYGDGSQTRSFCYVSDTIDGLLRLMESDCSGPVNIGNPDERTVGDLADTVIRMTGSGSPIVNRPLPADDPVRRRPDIGLARERLGWQPEVSLEQGLGETIGYFRRELGLDVPLRKLA